MKKLLGILVLGLLWCNVGFAGDYKNLLKKAKTASKEQIQEITKLTISKVAKFNVSDDEIKKAVSSSERSIN